MSESPACKMIEFHFSYQLWVERLPFHRTLRAPAAQPAWRFSREPRWLNELFKLLCKRRSVFCMNGRRVTHMIELLLFIVKTQEQRAHQLFLLEVTESAHYAIGRAFPLNFL